MFNEMCIESDGDSDETIEFDFQAHLLNFESETRKSMSQCTFDVNQLVMKEQQFLKNYNRLKSATRQIRKFLNEHPKLLSDPKIIDEVDRVRKVDLHWDSEMTQYHNFHDSANKRSDELLASIKRSRWCYICLKEAHIQDEVSATQFFCSIECQLKFYDS